MKQQKLIAAVAAVSTMGFVQQASALEAASGVYEGVSWSLDIGGFYEVAPAYAEGDSTNTAQDFDGLDVSTDAEIHFQPSVQLENGITVGAHVEFEGETNGDEVDESFVFVRGDFGAVEMGSTNSAGYKMSLMAPTAVNVLFGDEASQEAPVAVGDFIPVSFATDSFYRGTLGTTRLENNRNNDAKRISYYTPKKAGAQLGVSYAHDANQDNFGPTSCQSGSNTICEIIDFAGTYELEFEGIGIVTSARYGKADTNSSVAGASQTSEVYGGGIHAKLTDTITVGGSYAEQKGLAVDNGRSFDIGVLVSIPDSDWDASLNYFDGSNNEATGKDEFDYWVLAASKQLNKLVTLNIFAATAETTTASTVDQNPDGNVAGASLQLTL